VLITIRHHTLSVPNYEMSDFSQDPFFMVLPSRFPTPSPKKIKFAKVGKSRQPAPQEYIKKKWKRGCR